MTTLIFLYVVSLVLAIWMVVRIWRGSPLLAICSVLIPGVVFIALIKNWGDPDSDIKIPFLLSVGVSVMLYFSLMNLAEEQYGFNEDGTIAFADDGFGADGFDYAYLAGQYTEEEREQLRREDPDFAMLLDQADGANQGNEQPSERWESATPVVASSEIENESAEVVDPVEQARRDKRSAASVMRQAGPIEIGPAYARLQTPSHFRFVAAPRLREAARLHQRTLDQSVIGWVVHERVSLAEDLAWFAEIRFRSVGHLQADGVSNSAQLQEKVSALGGEIPDSGMFAPTWSSSGPMMTWTHSVAGSSAVEAVASLPLRHGVLSYVVRVPETRERELALRTARLLATETTVDEGWRFADAPPDTPAKGPSLALWVSNVATAAGAAAAEQASDAEDS